MVRRYCPRARRSRSPTPRQPFRRWTLSVERWTLTSMDENSEIPTALGYRMPAEWEAHAATWLSWPRREGISFPESFDHVFTALRAMVEVLIESEQICINVCN